MAHGVNGVTNGAPTVEGRSVYNIALRKRAFSLANTLDPSAGGLHADANLFVFFFSTIFFIDVDTF